MHFVWIFRGAGCVEMSPALQPDLQNDGYRMIGLERGAVHQSGPFQAPKSLERSAKSIKGEYHSVTIIL